MRCMRLSGEALFCHAGSRQVSASRMGFRLLTDRHTESGLLSGVVTRHPEATLHVHPKDADVAGRRRADLRAALRAPGSPPPARRRLSPLGLLLARSARGPTIAQSARRPTARAPALSRNASRAPSLMTPAPFRPFPAGSGCTTPGRRERTSPRLPALAAWLLLLLLLIRVLTHECSSASQPSSSRPGRGRPGVGPTIGTPATSATTRLRHGVVLRARRSPPPWPAIPLDRHASYRRPGRPPRQTPSARRGSPVPPRSREARPGASEVHPVCCGHCLRLHQNRSPGGGGDYDDGGCQGLNKDSPVLVSSRSIASGTSAFVGCVCPTGIGIRSVPGISCSS